MSRGKRNKDFCNGVQFITGFGGKEPVEYASNFSEHLTADIKGSDGILEARCLLIGYYGYDLGILLLNSFFEGWQEMFIFNDIEWRNAKGRIIFVKERIHGRLFIRLASREQDDYCYYRYNEVFHGK